MPVTSYGGEAEDEGFVVVVVIVVMVILSPAAPAAVVAVAVAAARVDHIIMDIIILL